jgi:Tfp pilus assembly protein PilV
MLPRRAAAVQVSQNGVTIIEVLTSVLLIFLGLGGIFAINIQSMEILRKTRQTVAASQMLQERIETMRSHVWPEISNSQALATLFQTPTQSAADLADLYPAESFVVTVPTLPAGTKASDYTFSLRRDGGNVSITQKGDLSAQPLLLVQGTVRWRDAHGFQQKQLRTIIGRIGLTRSGVFGSIFGRPAEGNSNSSLSASR